MDTMRSEGARQDQRAALEPRRSLLTALTDEPLEAFLAALCETLRGIVGTPVCVVEADTYYEQSRHNRDLANEMANKVNAAVEQDRNHALLECLDAVTRSSAACDALDSIAHIAECASASRGELVASTMADVLVAVSEVIERFCPLPVDARDPRARAGAARRAFEILGRVRDGLGPHHEATAAREALGVVQSIADAMVDAPEVDRVRTAALRFLLTAVTALRRDAAKAGDRIAESSCIAEERAAEAELVVVTERMLAREPERADLLTDLAVALLDRANAESQPGAMCVAVNQAVDLLRSARERGPADATALRFWRIALEFRVACHALLLEEARSNGDEETAARARNTLVDALDALHREDPSRQDVTLQLAERLLEVAKAQPDAGDGRAGFERVRELLAPYAAGTASKELLAARCHANHSLGRLLDKIAGQAATRGDVAAERLHADEAITVLDGVHHEFPDDAGVAVTLAASLARHAVDSGDRGTWSSIGRRIAEILEPFLSPARSDADGVPRGLMISELRELARELVARAS